PPGGRPDPRQPRALRDPRQRRVRHAGGQDDVSGQRDEVGTGGGTRRSSSSLRMRRISSKDLPSISALILSRISRINSTAFTGGPSISIGDYLARWSDLQKRIPETQVYGVITPDLRQVDDVAKVPAHENIDTGYNRSRDMKR